MAAHPRALLAVLIPLGALAACDPPPAVREEAAAADLLVPAVDRRPVDQPLPAPVAETVRQLREIAATGSWRDMARLAGATPGFRSNNAGMSHGDYWYLKLRTGDWPMEQVGRVLALPHAETDTDIGKVYIWPRLATVAPDEITPLLAREIDALLGEGQADAVRNGAPWPGYVLGIAADGTWLYFVSGAG